MNRNQILYPPDLHVAPSVPCVLHGAHVGRRRAEPGLGQPRARRLEVQRAHAERGRAVGGVVLVPPQLLGQSPGAEVPRGVGGGGLGGVPAGVEGGRTLRHEDLGAGALEGPGVSMLLLVLVRLARTGLHEDGITNYFEGNV